MLLQPEYFCSVRIEGRELQKRLVQLSLFVYDTVHDLYGSLYQKYINKKFRPSSRKKKKTQVKLIERYNGASVIVAQIKLYSSTEQQQSQMINKKLSDLFLRKEAKKQEPKAASYFDETSFECHLTSKGVNTDLIRIQTQIKDSGMPLDEIKCKWYIKNTHDFKEIEQVTSSYYQPCLDDVGSIICVQIEPFIEGKKYNGITIMEETEIIEIDNALEEQLDNFLQTKALKLDARIQAIYSQNQKYQELQLPFEVKIQINQQEITFMSGEKIIQRIKISQEFPNIQFIRKTFSSILFNYNENESMKLSLSNNFNRDLLVLIVRTCAAHACSLGINPEIEETEPCRETEKVQTQNKIESGETMIEHSQNSESQQCIEKQASDSVNNNSENNSPIVSTESLEGTAKSVKCQKEKADEAKHNSTLFVLKLDQVNKELKALKRKHQNLEHNYAIQKKGKFQAQTDLEIVKKQAQAYKKERDEALSIARKVKQLKEDNRFYKNEILIIKKDWKEEKEKRSALERKLQQLTCEKNEELTQKLETAQRFCQEMRLLKQQADRKCQEFESQIQKSKEQAEKLANQNQMLKKKLQSLANQKGLPKAIPSPQKKISKGNGQEQRVAELEMKIKSLEMLLKYKGQNGQANSGFQLLVNKLTETITQKELQLNEIKKVNKDLLVQLKEARQLLK